MTMPVGGGNNQQANVTVNANVDPFVKGMGAASRAAASFGNALKAVDDSILKITKRVGIGVAGGSLLGIFGDIKSLQKAADFQKSMAALSAQSGVTGKNLDQVATSIQTMSRTIPIATQQLAQLTTQVVAVGVKGTANITQMTVAASKLAAATNTPPGQLFTGLAQLGQTMGNSLQTIERYGSVLTKLQQNMGVNAQGTLDFASGIEAVAQKAGVGEASVLGLSAAFQKLGIDSTAGAQAFNQVMNDMTDAVNQGSARLNLFAATLGMTTQQFKALFATNPAQAFTDFVNVIASQGQKATDILGQFGLDSVRTLRIFAALSSGQANLAGALQQANSAYTQNAAMSKAASAAWNTLAADTTRLGNSFTFLQQTIGAPFVRAMDTAVNTVKSGVDVLGNAAHYLNSLHIPFLTDGTASAWASHAAGVGLLAGAFGIAAASIVKFMGVWRMLSGVLGGQALRGFFDAMKGGWFSHGPSSPFMQAPQLRPGMSRTQLYMYRGGYDFARLLRRGGTAVDPETGAVGRSGLVGAAAMFPFTRARQMFRQTYDTALHPFNAANRDPNATDPFSLYGGYQQLVRYGGNARNSMIAHLTREGASDFERSLGERMAAGFGNPDTSAARLRTDRWAYIRDVEQQTRAMQFDALMNMSPAQRQQAMTAIWLEQNPEAAAAGKLPPDYNRMSSRQFRRFAARGANFVAGQAARQAGNTFDERVPNEEQAKLLNPFRKLAEGVKEVTKQLLTETNATIKAMLEALVGYYRQAADYVAKLAAYMRAAASGGATGAVPPPPPPYGPNGPQTVGAIHTKFTPPHPYGPGGPKVINMPEGTEVPASSTNWPFTPVYYRDLDPRQAARAAVIGPTGDLTHLTGPAAMESDSAIKSLVGKFPQLGKGLEVAAAAAKATGAALMDLVKGAGQMVLGFFKSGWMLQLAIWGPVAAMGLSALGNMLNKTAPEMANAGAEIVQALGGTYTSAYQLAKNKKDAQNNNADQTPYGPNDVSDAQSSSFAASHANSLALLQSVSGTSPMAQQLAQQQVNALLQQTNSGTLNPQYQGQVRQLLIAAYGTNQARQIMANLNMNGAATDVTSALTSQFINAGTTDITGANSSLLNAVGTTAANDYFSNNNGRSILSALLGAQAGGNSPNRTFLAKVNDELRLDQGSSSVGDTFNSIIDNLNAQLPDGQKIKVSTPFGMSNNFTSYGSLNEVLDSLNQKHNFLSSTPNSAARALYAELETALRNAGVALDSTGHIAESTASALKKLQEQADATSAAQSQLTPAQQALAMLSANAIYRLMYNQPDGFISGMLSNPNSSTFGLDMYRLNQELIKQNPGNQAPTAATDVSILSDQFIPGLNHAAGELVKTMDAIGTGPQSQDWQALLAQLNTDVAQLQSSAALRLNPAQALTAQANLLGTIASNASSPNDTQLITDQITTTTQAADQQLQVLQQAYEQVQNLHIQQRREYQDFTHQMELMQRDYNISVAEANYQFQVQQRESAYQFNVSQAEQLWSFNQSIRQMKYSIADAFGTAGTIVPAQYTEGAQSALAGFGQQTKDLQASLDAINKLQAMGLSTDVIRVFKLDQPQNFAQAQRYLSDFLSNPQLIKQFNDLVAKNLNIANAMAQNPGNSQYADLKLQFDHQAQVAGQAFAHATELASEQFAHSMQLQAQQFANSLGDYTYSFNLQMQRETEDLNRMLLNLTQTPQQLIDWAMKSGIPGLHDVAQAVEDATQQIAAANAQLERIRQLQLAAQDAQQYGYVTINGVRTQIPASAVDQSLGLNGQGQHTVTPSFSSMFNSIINGVNQNFDTHTGSLGPGGILGSLTTGVLNIPPGGSAPLGSSGFMGNSLAGIGNYESALGGVAAQLGTVNSSYADAQSKISDYKKITSDAASSTNQQKTALGNVTTAIQQAVTQVGNQVAAQDANKDSTAKANDVITAQQGAFQGLTQQLGFVPPGLQLLGQHLGITDQNLGTTTGNVGTLHSSIANLPDRNVAITADTGSATGAVYAFLQFTQDAMNSAVTVINQGLIGAWDYVVAALGLPANLNVAAYQWNPFIGTATFSSAINGPQGSGFGGKMRAFATGGYTGDGGKYQPAGVVHAGEYVVDAERTRRFRPLLDAVMRAPGYASGGPVMTWPQLDAIRRQMFPGSVLTSAYRPGENDYHGLGEAIDIGVYGNLQSGLMPIAAALAARYPNSTELIHNPNASIKNGQVVPPSFWGAATWAEHLNHVHWAMTPQALAGVSGIAQAILDPGSYINTAIANVLPQLNGAEGAPILKAVPAALLAHMLPLLTGYLHNVGAPGNAPVGSNVYATIQQIAGLRGWGAGSEWDALGQLIAHESSWNPFAQNPTSTAYGLFQFLDSTWAATGFGKTSDPRTQTLAGLAYITSRYGDPINAWNFWQAHHWYANGGVATGRSLVGVGEAGPEAIIPLNGQGQAFMADTMRAALQKMTTNPTFVAEMSRARTSGYASPARSEMHFHHTDCSTNFSGAITVQAQDPNEMARKLAARKRTQALVRPVARR